MYVKENVYISFRVWKGQTMYDGTGNSSKGETCYSDNCVGGEFYSLLAEVITLIVL